MHNILWRVHGVGRWGGKVCHRRILATYTTTSSSFIKSLIAWEMAAPPPMPLSNQRGLTITPTPHVSCLSQHKYTNLFLHLYSQYLPLFGSLYQALSAWDSKGERVIGFWFVENGGEREKEVWTCHCFLRSWNMRKRKEIIREFIIVECRRDERQISDQNPKSR